MLSTPDLYIGVFLILCGFGLSLFNLRRVVMESKNAFPSVLISENLLLMCVGIAFVSKSVYHLNPVSMEMGIDSGSLELMSLKKAIDAPMECKFWMVVMSYGPLIIGLVNSFLTLVIDNYMHYRMIEDVKKKDEENTVQELNDDTRVASTRNLKRLSTFLKRYFSYIAVGLQWIVPVLAAISMYFMNVHEKKISLGNLRSLSQSCMSMVDVSNDTCIDFDNVTTEFRKYLPNNYLELQENSNPKGNESQIDSVIKNVFDIVSKLKNESNFVNVNVSSIPLYRKQKEYSDCMRVCYVDNKNLLLYMFILSIVSYFVPITISVAILTKLHIMNIKTPNMKAYVSRELLYNILFWSPVMFDTFLSLMLCSYSMNGMRVSIFNVIANVYQAVKNIMNTKYFHNNTVVPA